jgi:hypothetical protein
MPTSEASGRATPHRLLRWALVLGAAYDIFFALLLFTVPDRASRWFGLPLAEPRFYIRLLAILLIMLGAAYLAAARDPERYRAVVWTAALGRLAGAALFAVEAAALPVLWPLAAGDGAFGLVTAWAARKLGR